MNSITTFTRAPQAVLFRSIAWLGSPEGQSRRFAFYHFRNFVRKPDPMLMSRIEAEIPALIGRFVKKYLAAAREHASKSFWDWCPKEVLKIQQELKSNMSYVGRFLALDKDHEDAIIGPEYDQKLVYTERSDHLSTPVMTLQKAFKEWMTKAHKNAQTDGKISKEMMERHRWEVCDNNVCRRWLESLSFLLLTRRFPGAPRRPVVVERIPSSVTDMMSASVFYFLSW